MMRLLAATVLVAATSAQADVRLDRAINAVAVAAEKAVRDQLVSGLAIAIVSRDGAAVVQGFGTRGGAGEPVGPDTAFQLASLSKPIAATVIARLVGDGALRWDAPVAALLPWFALSDAHVSAQLTIGHLLSHRSGLPGDAGNDLELFGFDGRAILERLRLVALDSTTLDRFAYSNFGFTAAGAAVAEATRTEWAKLVQDRLFTPLEMTSATATYTTFIARKNRASPHTLMDGAWVAGPAHDGDAEAPAGGMAASARDLANFAGMLLDGGRWGGRQLVAEEALRMAMTPVVDAGPMPGSGRLAGYGMGWFATLDPKSRRVSHPGASTSGARTLIDMMPDEGLAIVVLANAYPSGVPEALAEIFYDTYIDGAPRKDWVAEFDTAIRELFEAFLSRFRAPPAAGALTRPGADYVATYEAPYTGQIDVNLEEKRLVMRVGPGGL